MLADPNARPTPEMRRAMLERFLELLEQENARRPAHRPRQNSGARVATLKEAGVDQKRAIAIAAKITGKSVATVERAWRRHVEQK